ncbi:hypothetical protein Q644_09935 [Brucella intermedia 229E]|uniref:Uncharacterized protein n=1 Tax=Brucella intermedia 229E TaxID=1337887 RepID=U4V4Q8_9HYPH|nr:hypothetical protein Q644_09935 [Brucella intermedia 229E]
MPVLSRNLYDQGNTEAFGIVTDLAEQVMIAQLFAMIAREDDQRVVPLTGFIEIGKDPPRQSSISVISPQ